VRGAFLSSRSGLNNEAAALGEPVAFRAGATTIAAGGKGRIEYHERPI
jgi:hypothetical protein